MKIFVSGRQSGKTQQAIEWAVEHGSYIVCVSRREATRVFRVAKDQGLDIHFPITYEELLHGQMGRGVESLVIENVDLLLTQLAGPRVIGFTATRSTE